MQTKAKIRWATIGSIFVLLFLIGGTVLVPYVLSVSEPAKLLLLGTGCLATALFARRLLKEEPKPEIEWENGVKKPESVSINH